MTDETLTVPCEGIGVWEGARVVYAPARGYQGSLRRPGDAGIVVATEQRGSAVWALAAFGADIEPHPLTCLRLDLTHRQTRNEAALRAATRHMAGDVVGLATIAAQEIASAWEAIGTPPAGTLAGAIRRIREGDYSRGQLSAILGRREGELTREAAARVVTERDEARAELARASHILAVERGDASRAPPGWHFDGMAWWRNDEPRRPIVLVCRRAGERRPASVWYRPGIDADADGPEFATALEAMEAEGAAQGDS